MKAALFIAALTIAGPGPALAQTAPQPAPAPIKHAAKADPAKPFVYDSLQRQLPAPTPARKTPAGPGVG